MSTHPRGEYRPFFEAWFDRLDAAIRADERAVLAATPPSEDASLLRQAAIVLSDVGAEHPGAEEALMGQLAQACERAASRPIEDAERMAQVMRDADAQLSALVDLDCAVSDLDLDDRVAIDRITLALRSEAERLYPSAPLSREATGSDGMSKTLQERIDAGEVYAGGCDKARKLAAVPDDFVCCMSCHSDDEAGYAMCDTTIDGREYDVCCAVANGIRDGKFTP